jgi:hypothetical protein
MGRPCGASSNKNAVPSGCRRVPTGGRFLLT